jgi:hypothetical protein
MKGHTQSTRIFTIHVENVYIFFRAFGGSLGSVLDSHADGPGSIPAVSGVMKVYGCNLKLW